MITEKMICELRDRIKGMMSEKRSYHTLAVEQMAIRLGRIYAPDKLEVLRSAALLHDITKEIKSDGQIELCGQLGINLTESDILAPKTLHARTAAAVIPRDFPEFAEPEIISAVRWHTTGRAGMTILDKMIYLADYIDDSRKFEDCVKLRNYFFDFDFDNATHDQKIMHLGDTLIISYDMTIKSLIENNAPISKDTFDARNELICAKLKAN